MIKMVSVIIAAGGTGNRMGAGMPKQFIEVFGKPLIIYTIEAFNNHPGVDEIIIPCHNDYKNKISSWVTQYGLSKVKSTVPAGINRKESVFNGLKNIKNTTSIVLIHDAVRPLVSNRIISENIEKAIKYGAAGTAVPAEDTVIKSKEGLFIDEVPKRNEIYNIQTPQSFKYDIIMDAHKSFFGTDATDDCQLVLKTGVNVALVLGDKINFKITTPEDMLLFELLIKNSYI